MTSIWNRVGALVPVAAVLVACGRTPNPDVCCVSQADCNALGVDEPVRICADGLICVEHACVPPVCELDVDCGAETPHCSGGACVGCRDAQDCAGTTPVCDESSKTCRACVKDADCSSNACDFESGMCIAPASVWYASPDGPTTGACSQVQPCALTTAVAAANAARPTVRMLPGIYNASLTLESTIAIHGDGASLLAPGTGMLVQSAANAKVYDLSISKQGGASAQERLGVYCASSSVATPRLHLERVVIEAQGEARALAANACSLTAVQTTLRAPKVATEQYLVLVASPGTVSFDRSRLEGGGGIAAAGGQITMTNSLLINLGGNPNEGALLSVAGGSVSVAYSTISESSLPCGLGDSPACASAARTGVCIENSIVLRPSASTDSISGDKCRCDYCMITPQQASVPGSGNTFGATLKLKDAANGDFHLLSGSDAIDAAHPSVTGTPDFDGTPRPQGTRSDVGAFEFKQ